MTGKTFSNASAAGISGTMPNNVAVTIVPTTTNQTIALGYHDGLGKVEGDADLVASKIVSDVVIFEVTGSAIAATGDAAAGDVLTGKTFSNASAAGIAGAMPNNGAVTIVPTTTQQTIAAGYHNGSGKVEGDADLVAGSIARGVDLFGVSGICRAVRATGQTTSYAAGDDGEYELGCRPGAYPVWGSKGFNRGFTDNGDGTVTDNLAGLIWLQDTNCISTTHATYGFDHDGTAGDGRVTWQHALDFVAGINAGTYSDCGAGQTDWRLPNINELSSLVDPVQTNPALPAGHPFTGVQSYPYWSSTTRTSYTPYAGRVNLSSGYVVNGSKTSSFYVWPVRGGQ